MVLGFTLIALVSMIGRPSNSPSRESEFQDYLKSHDCELRTEIRRWDMTGGTSTKRRIYFCNKTQETIEREYR